MTYLAIDPGADAGWAIFDDDGTLASCGLGEPPPGWGCHGVIVECPYVYPRSPVDPNGLIVLARRVGRYEERFAKWPVVLVFPRQWKGTVPKDLHCDRTLKALPPSELARYQECVKAVAASKKHNVIDAIGLGKWAFREGPWRKR